CRPPAALADRAEPKASYGRMTRELRMYRSPQLSAAFAMADAKLNHTTGPTGIDVFADERSHVLGRIRVEIQHAIEGNLDRALGLGRPAPCNTHPRSVAQPEPFHHGPPGAKVVLQHAFATPSPSAATPTCML